MNTSTMKQTLPDRGTIRVQRDESAAVAGAGHRRTDRSPLQDVQRALGNRAFGRLLQARLTVGPADDVYEREADRVADSVAASIEGAPPGLDAGGHAGSALPAAPTIQRMCARCAEGEEEERVQRSPDGGASSVAASDTAADVAGLQGGGAPMEPAVRSHFERGFGASFAGVRVHTDARAARAADALNARAFTIGGDIAFASGMYRPETSEGRRLLAHELTHVVQQGAAEGGGAGMASAITPAPITPAPITPAPITPAPITPAQPAIQRAIRLRDPATHTTYLSAADNRLTRAQLLQRWLNQLCSDGSWSVDAASGLVSSGAAAGFCNATAPSGTTAPGGATAGASAHHTTSSAPTSCGCLCELTRTGGRNADIVIDQTITESRWVPPNQGNPPLDIYTIEDQTYNLANEGEGATMHRKDFWIPNDTVIVSGRDHNRVRGAGDTSPQSGTSPNQVLRDPPWIILGHELCGHLLRPDPVEYYHSQTPEGDRTAVDIENRIRREHSTARDNYGIRRGSGAGGDGSVVVLRSGENGDALCRRLGIPIGTAAWSSGEHRWLFSEWSGDAYDQSSYAALTGGERLFARGVFYHDVMAGQTLAAIARTWGVTAAALQRANPGVVNPPASGTRLIIPRQ